MHLIFFFSLFSILFQIFFTILEFSFSNFCNIYVTVDSISRKRLKSNVKFCYDNISKIRKFNPNVRKLWTNSYGLKKINELISNKKKDSDYL